MYVIHVQHNTPESITSASGMCKRGTNFTTAFERFVALPAVKDHRADLLVLSRHCGLRVQPACTNIMPVAMATALVCGVCVCVD